MADITMLLNKLDVQFRGGTIFGRRVQATSTLAEQRMRAASGKVRMRRGWLDEANSSGSAWSGPLVGLTEKESAAVVNELWFFASLHKRDTDIRLTSVDGVWGSAARGSPQLMSELQQWAHLLELDVGEDHRRSLKRKRAKAEQTIKWQDEEDASDDESDAESTEQVVYLVDPSMYPLIYSASTLVRPRAMTLANATRLQVMGQSPGSAPAWKLAMRAGRGGDGSQRALYLPVGPDWAVSAEYCWLPAEFQLDRQGRATLQSYINNLNPDRFGGFYTAIERVLTLLVPVLEQVLTDVAHPRSARAPSGLSKWWTNGSDSDGGYAPAERSRAWERFSARPEDPQSRAATVSDRPVIPYTLHGQRLQAVVELSNIVLTPSAPVHRSAWAVDGMANERIIATGVLYYASDNIARATTAFREPVQAVADCDANSAPAMGRVYGLNPAPGRAHRMTRPAGKVVIEAGGCIVYPNTYQHRTTVRLADSQQPGVLRRLVVYFVDPSTRIPSSEVVPPQQRTWQRLDGDTLVRGIYLTKQHSHLTRLAITPDSAELVREAMVAERAQAMADLNAALFEPKLHAAPAA